MDMNESGEKGMEGNASSGGGIPVEWQTQFSAAAFACPPAQHQGAMMDSAFASAGLWASTSQAMALSDVGGAMSAARGGGGFLAPVPGFLPHGLGQFPVDSGFIERAARASCYGGGAGVMGASAGFGAGDQSMNGAFSGSSEALLDHQRKDGSNEKPEPELGRNGHDGVPSSEAAGGDCSSKGTSDSKKRRRPNEVMGGDQVQSSNLPADSANESVHSKDKGEESSPVTTTGGKTKGKGAKETSEKEDYIHVRARRGQATNSHSLAERFLSMKLATVNPRLDLNIEGLLSKDLLRFPGVTSSSLGFSPEMMHPQLQLSQPGLIQGGAAGMANPDVFRRIIQAQLSAKDGSQMSHALNGTFSDVAQMAYPSLGSQDLGIRPSQDGFQM